MLLSRENGFGIQRIDFHRYICGIKMLQLNVTLGGVRSVNLSSTELLTCSIGQSDNRIRS
jgi:hypothetical protein